MSDKPKEVSAEVANSILIEAKAKRKENRQLLLISTISVLVFLGIWELAVRVGWIDSKYLCAPTTVVKTFIQKLSDPKPDGAVLGVHIITSLKLVLGEQLRVGLDGVDKSKIVIGYEPIWSIGPGKTPADKEYITKIARFVKEVTGGCDMVYGGGLKKDNAEMLASIDEIDGGLIGLTRFSGEIGFDPDEYLEIIKLYLGK